MKQQLQHWDDSGRMWRLNLNYFVCEGEVMIMRFADVRMLEKIDDTMWCIKQFGIHDSDNFETRTEALQELFEEGFAFYAYFLNPNQELWVKM